MILEILMGNLTFFHSGTIMVNAVHLLDFCGSRIQSNVQGTYKYEKTNLWDLSSRNEQSHRSAQLVSAVP